MRYRYFRTIITLALFCSSFTLLGQINFNYDWSFIRLQDEAANDTEIKNQGSDWSSQYNVTHISANAELQLSADDLSEEFRIIENSKWENVSLPHTAKVEDFVVLHQWQGTCYYKKEFEAEKGWKGKSCYVEFEGAMQLADVWVNGKHLLQHAGGYTPFVVDISEILKFDEKNEILVRLDNRNNPLIPPGKPLENLDFCYYSGIYRDVNLIVKNKVQISHPILANEVAGGGVFVTFPKVDKNKSIVAVKSHLINKSEASGTYTLRQELFEIDGIFCDLKTGRKIISTEKVLELQKGSDKHIQQNLEVNNPKLWFPDSPHLYLLRTQILDGKKVIDTEETRIGIRRIKYSRDNGCTINGKKVRLVGSNRHMEYPYVGNAISDNAQYRDIWHIKESGFNTVRLGHYPQDKSVLDACDELGVLAIEPIPGWQFFNKNETFKNLTYRDVRDMIRRDRNHPSVIMWEVILNESNPPKEWKDMAAQIAHDEYPGDQCFTSGDSYGYTEYDVQYNDWEHGFNRPNNSGKPGFIREYYDYEFGGHYSTTRITRGDGEKALLQNAWNAQWSHNRYRAYYPWTVGDAVWSMYDYNRGCCDNICYSGVADVFRLNKWSVPFFKSQLPIGQKMPAGEVNPYIFIANYWDNQPEENKLIVYSNTDEVALLVNGKEVARQKADNGEDSNYGPEELWAKGGNPFDGGNCKNLAKAPFTFSNITWEKGKVETLGYINNEELARHKVETPLEPIELTIDYFEAGKPAAVNDILIVYVKLKDVNNTLCVNHQKEVTLHVEEGGKLIGPSIVSSEAGIASFIIKTNSANKLILKATTDVMLATMKLKL